MKKRQKSKRHIVLVEIILALVLALGCLGMTTKSYFYSFKQIARLETYWRSYQIAKKSFLMFKELLLDQHRDSFWIQKCFKGEKFFFLSSNDFKIYLQCVLLYEKNSIKVWGVNIEVILGNEHYEFKDLFSLICGASV